MFAMHTKRGFTLIEILLVVGILVILFSVMLLKTRSLFRSTQAYDVERKAEAQALEKGTAQYIIDNQALVPGVPVGTAADAKDICQSAVTGNACSAFNGVDLSTLVPVYLAAIPVDPAMSGSTVTGYKIWSDGEDAFVTTPYLGRKVTPGAGAGQSSTAGAASSVPGTASSSSSSAAASGLLGHWKLDDASGTTAADASGNGRNGTLTNGPSWTTGLLSGGLQFDGANDHVTVPGGGIRSLGTFTLAAWIQPYTHRLSRIAAVPDVYGLALMANGKIGYALAPQFGSVRESASSIEPNIWTHVALVYNGSSVTLYINGSVDSTVTGVSGNTANTANAFQIGGDPSAYFFNGKIDDVRLYGTALAAPAVSALAQAGLDGPIAYWKLDEGSGTSVADASGNGKTLTLANGPTWSASPTAPLTFSNPYSLSFDGSNDYGSANVTIDNYPRITLAAWVYPRNAGDNLRQILSNDDGNFDRGISAHWSGRWHALTGNTAADTNAPIGYNSWAHVALVYSSANIEFYLNGARVWQRGSAATGYSGSAQLQMGRSAYSGGSSYFAGNIDDARVYDRVLTAAEIATLARGDALP